MGGMMCKGSWALGTACGYCKRCVESAPNGRDTETVVLEGGPSHGKTIAWRGGDTIHFMEDAAQGYSAPDDEQKPIQLATHVYLRTLYRRTTFTYQGVLPQ